MEVRKVVLDEVGGLATTAAGATQQIAMAAANGLAPVPAPVHAPVRAPARAIRALPLRRISRTRGPYM